MSLKRSQAISDFIKRNRRLFIYLTIAFIFIFIVFISYNINSLQKRAKKINREFGVLITNYINDSINQMERIKSFSDKNLNFYLNNEKDIKAWIKYNELGNNYNYREIKDEFYNKHIQDKLNYQKVDEIKTFIFNDNNKSYLGIIYPQNGYNDFALYSINNFLNKLPRISNFELKTLNEKDIILSNKNLESYNFIYNNNSKGFNLKKGIFLSSSHLDNYPYKLYLVYDLSKTVKKIILFLLIIFIGCNTNYPKQFSEPANLEMLIGLDNSKITLREVLYQHKGKKIVIDVWASWCKDCIVGFPKVKALQEEFPEVVFLFLSVDLSNHSWRKAIKKYNVIGEHYNLPKGMNDGDFIDFINLGWIPRYMVIDEKGEIALFKAINASDKNIQKALKKTK